jgi:hypothetical protein
MSIIIHSILYIEENYKLIKRKKGPFEPLSLKL